MFKPISMRKITLFLTKEDTKKITENLYDLKLMQFLEVKNENFEKFEHEDLNEYSASLLKLRSTITNLKEYFTKENINPITNAIEETNIAKTKEEEIKKEIIKLKDELKRNIILKGLKATKNELNDNNTTIGFIPNKNSQLLKKFIVNKIKYKKYEYENRIYFIAKTNKKFFNFKEFYLPKSTSVNIKEKLTKKNEELKKIKNKLIELANNNLRHLQKEELKLSKEIATLEAKNKFAKTKNITVLSGYVPTNKIKKLKINLEKNLTDKYQLDIEKPDENAPVLLNNTGMSKSFESLLRMYSMPKYSEFDPTMLIFLVFPLFYGFILGDVGYGLLSLLFFTIIKNKLKNIKEFINILQISSISSIIFGFIYGEYFGFEPFHALLPRYHDPVTLLIIALVFGAIHVNIGIIIGFVNELHNLKHAITDKLSWIVLEFGVLFIFLGSYLYSAIPLTLLGGGLVLISAIMLYIAHGIMGINEIPSFFTNIFSYARLMAVGLSSVAIAILINDFSVPLIQSGIIPAVFGIIIFTLGHAFNIVLGNFESFLHSLRLHYVEFFTKFYTGGGKEFEPFGQKIREEIKN